MNTNDTMVSMNKVIKIVEDTNVNLDYNEERMDLINQIKGIEPEGNKFIDYNAAISVVLKAIGAPELTEELLIRLKMNGGASSMFADILWGLIRLPCVSFKLPDNGLGDFVSREAILDFPVRKDSYDEENGSIDFISGVEMIMEFVEALPSGIGTEVNEVIRGKI